MFSATVHQIVKTLGRDSLLPVPSVETADNISPLRLVIKEQSRYCFFWKKYKIYTTEFGLKDILESGETDDLNVKENTNKLTSYDRTTNFSLKGKFGVELMHELLDIGSETTDSVTVESHLGDLEKVEVDMPCLLSALKNRKINLTSPRIASLVNQHRKIVGIITGVIRLMNDAKLSSKLNVKGSANVGFKSLAVCGGKVDAEVDEDRVKSITLPKGTHLAYTMHDLLISATDGTFKVVLEHGAKGGFTQDKLIGCDDFDDVDAPDSSFVCLGASEEEQKMFTGLTDLDSTKKEEFRNVIKNIMALPKLVQPISDLFQRAETFIDTGIKRTTNMNTLNSKIGSENDDLVQFLTLAGFRVESNGDVEYPEECTDMFEACQLLMCLLDELDDNEIEALADCLDDEHTSHLMMNILMRAEVTGCECLTLSEDERAMLSTDTAKTLIETLQLSVEGHKMTFSKENIAIKASSLVLQAFFGSK